MDADFVGPCTCDGPTLGCPIHGTPPPVDTGDPHLALQAAALRLLRDLPTETAVGVCAEFLGALCAEDLHRLIRRIDPWLQPRDVGGQTTTEHIERDGDGMPTRLYPRTRH